MHHGQLSPSEQVKVPQTLGLETDRTLILLSVGDLLNLIDDKATIARPLPLRGLLTCTDGHTISDHVGVRICRCLGSVSLLC